MDVFDDVEAKGLDSGLLALQLHAGQPMTVRFKDIRIKSLRSAAESAAGNVRVATGFKLDLLYSVPKETQGSWVALCTDPKGRLIAADSQPASISLSNLGKSGIDRFEAIINPGQSSILAVGRELERVIARAGMPVVVRGFNLTFSVDHRLIDGMAGAAFLGALAERIEFGPWGAG